MAGGVVVRRQAPATRTQLLLDIVGLHPGSVEWSQRYAESLKTLFNRLNLLGLGGFVAALLIAARAQSRPRELLTQPRLRRRARPADPRPVLLRRATTC